jgi:hypothetical protein
MMRRIGCLPKIQPGPACSVFSSRARRAGAAVQFRPKRPFRQRTTPRFQASPGVVALVTLGCSMLSASEFSQNVSAGTPRSSRLSRPVTQSHGTGDVAAVRLDLGPNYEQNLCFCSFKDGGSPGC